MIRCKRGTPPFVPPGCGECRKPITDYHPVFFNTVPRTRKDIERSARLTNNTPDTVDLADIDDVNAAAAMPNVTDGAVGPVQPPVQPVAARAAVSARAAVAARAPVQGQVVADRHRPIFERVYITPESSLGSLSPQGTPDATWDAWNSTLDRNDAQRRR